MRTGFGVREPKSGSSAAGFDLRALDHLGIKRLITDSRRVKRGDTFVAYPGESRDGRGYIAQAVIDYAHTPDALAQVLLALRELIDAPVSRLKPHASRLICVLGCRGDRERGKRPLMGRIATRLADCVVVTSDSPRSENPLAIIGEILDGMRGVREKLAVARAALRGWGS